MTEVFHFIAEEEAFLQLQLDTRALEEVQDVLEVYDVLVVVLGEHDDVVNVDEAHLPPNTRQYDIQRTLEGRRRIAEAERHAQIPVRPHVTGERCLVPVFLCDGHLPVSPKGVQEGEHLGTSEAVDAVIHPGKRIRVGDG